MIIPNISGKIKNVPNHQPDIHIMRFYIITMYKQTILGYPPFFWDTSVSPPVEKGPFPGLNPRAAAVDRSPSPGLPRIRTG